MAIKHVIKVTSQQWEDLKTTGQTIDADGNIHQYDGSGETVYNVYDYDEIIALNNKIDDTLRHVVNNFPSVSITDLETVYNNIIESDSSLEEMSAVGMRIELKNGDTILKQNAIIYINGILQEIDYTYTGDNVEVANVWYFENNGSLILAQIPDYKIQEITIKQLHNAITINESYYLYTPIINEYGFVNSSLPLGTLEHNIYSEGNISLSDYGNSNKNKISKNIQKLLITAFGITTSGSYSATTGLTKLKYLDLPNLEILTGDTGNWESGFSGCNNPELIINMPKLKEISTSNRGFAGVYAVTIPETVERIVDIPNFKANHVITLNCRNATSIGTRWCGSDASYAPTILNICDDWKATINLAYAGYNRTDIAWWEDLIENKLAVVTNQTLTVPATMFTQLNTVEKEPGLTWVDYALTKGWTIGGA